MSTSTTAGTTGLFAKMVAKFLVPWVKKTLTTDTRSQHEALAAPPAPLPGTTPPAQPQPPYRPVQPGVSRSAVWDPRIADRQLASMYSGEHTHRREALRAADPAALRRCGLSETQVAQAGAGRVPAGYQMEPLPQQAGQAGYQLTPLTPQTQQNLNSVNLQIISLHAGDVSVISLPVGGEQITIVIGGGAVMAG